MQAGGKMGGMGRALRDAPGLMALCFAAMELLETEKGR